LCRSLAFFLSFFCQSFDLASVIIVKELENMKRKIKKKKKNNRNFILKQNINTNKTVVSTEEEEEEKKTIKIRGKKNPLIEFVIIFALYI
jgi:uncharacterized protein with gpF-like domain